MSHAMTRIPFPAAIAGLLALIATACGPSQPAQPAEAPAPAAARADLAPGPPAPAPPAAARVLPLHNPAGPAEANSAWRLFTRFDANSDGRLERAELPPQLESLFTKADKDNDGVLTQQEVEALRTPGPGGPVGPRPGMMRGQSPTHPRPIPGDPGNVFRHLDVNGDNQLTRDEIPSRISPALQRADANQDGIISLEEFEAVRQHMLDRGFGGGHGPRGPGQQAPGPGNAPAKP